MRTTLSVTQSIIWQLFSHFNLTGYLLELIIEGL